MVGVGCLVGVNVALTVLIYVMLRTGYKIKS
jgi:hypothetical protein